MSETVAGYRILRELGRGAEGVVYLAESPGIGKTVALKVFDLAHQARYERALETYRALEQVRQESGSLSHLAEGIAAGPLPEGGGFLAMAYQASGSLADRVREAGALAPSSAVELTRQVLSGLSALHEAGLCHRDVKPHNVLLDTEGQAVLGDFGLVSEREATISTGGTPAFAAPEQWSVDHSGEGDPAPRRSGIAIDVYGAGATLYYLLTGRSPVPGAPDLFLLESRDVPRPLQTVLLRALAPRAGDRFPSALEFQSALQAALDPPPAPVPQGRSGLLAGLVVLVLAGAAFWAAQGPLSAQPPQTPPPKATTGATPMNRTTPTPAPATPEASPRLPSPLGSSPTPQPTPSAAATPRPVPSPEAPTSPLATRIQVQGTEISLVHPDGERTQLTSYAAPPLLAVALSDGRYACTGVALAGQPPVLDVIDANGTRAIRLPLSTFPTRLLALPQGRAALATGEGAVLLLDPSGTGSTRELTRFAHAVVDLELREGSLWVQGDDRKTRPLPKGEEPKPNETLIEGVLGRYAFPLTPLLKERVLGL